VAGRLTIIGGGVMGLITAYYAAPLASSVTVLERSRGTVYDIGRFTPARFAGGAAGEPLAGGMAS
jgi:glycine/D-amino acid oxidase-like deaminating enzyme